MNIVYGGSFNPPTLAHLKIVNMLKEKFNLNKIIILPTGNSYTWKETIKYEDRLNMIRLTFKEDIILDIENKEKYEGTYSALNIISKEYDDLYFCMGADNLVQIKKWIKWQELLKNYRFIVFNRNQVDLKKFISDELFEYKDHFILVEGFCDDTSSTKFRQSKDKSLVTNDVYDYILKNHLYEV